MKINVLKKKNNNTAKNIKRENEKKK